MIRSRSSLFIGAARRTAASVIAFAALALTASAALAGPAEPCAADLDGDGSVTFTDVTLVLADWGPCAPSCPPADLDASGSVDLGDVLAVLAAFGVDCDGPAVLRDDALAWFQFDRIDRFVNEASPGTYDLFRAGRLDATYEPDAAGIEYQARFMNGAADALAIEDSNGTSTGFKPVAANGSSVEYYIHFTAGTNPSGTRTVLGRFLQGANEFRLFLFDGELRFVVVDGVTNPILDTDVVPSSGQRIHVFCGWTTERSPGAQDGSSWIEVRDDAGRRLGSAASTGLGTLSAAGFAGREVHLGGANASDAGGPDMAVHALAAWTRPTTSAERTAIVDGGDGVRWWAVDRAGLLAAGERFSTPVSGDHFGNVEAVGGLFSGDRQMIYLSDSYGWLVRNSARPFAALMHAKAPETWAAVQLPYDNPSVLGTFASAETRGVTAAPINQASGYAVQGGASNFPLNPFHGVSVDVSSAFAGGGTPILQVEVDRVETASAESGTFEDPGHVDYGALLSYRKATADAYPSVLVAGATVDLMAGDAGLCNASPIIDIGDYDPDAPLAFDIQGTTSPPATQYLDIMAVTLVKTTPAGVPIDGFYLSGVADVSWSYVSHGADAPSTGQKRYTVEQAASYIDGTSIDDGQDITITCFMDLEPADQEGHADRIRGTIDLWRAAHAASRRTGDISFLVIVPPLIATGGSGARSMDGIKRHAYWMRKACEEIVVEHPEDVAWVSIAEFTEYHHWTSVDVGSGGFDLGDDSGSEWLLANGFATLSYGTNVDVELATLDGTAPRDLISDGSHPDSEVGNVFFWRIVTDVVP